MSLHSPTLRERVTGARLDVVGAVLGVLLALGLFPLRFLSSQIYIRTLPIVVGVACGLYLFAVRTDRSRNSVPRFGSGFARFAPTVVCLGLAGMVLLATLSGRRTVSFYDLGALVGTMLFAQVLFLRDRHFHPGVVLTQVVAFGFLVRFAALYTAPGFVGVDVWSHTTYVETMLRDGSLAAISDSKYYASPFYHVLTVAATELYGVSLRNGLYLSLGVVMPLSVLLVYGAAGTLVPPRWAAFAATTYVVADHAVRWGIHVIPTSMGLVFFLALLFSLLHLLQTDTNPRDYALLVLFSTAVILTHQISSFIMLVLLGTGLVGQVLVQFDFFDEPAPNTPFLYQLSEPVSLVGVLAFDVGLITFMWSLTPYRGDTFLETVVNYLYVTLVSSAGFMNGVTSDGSGSAAAGGGSVGSQFVAELVTYLDTLGFLLLLCATIVGSLVVLRRRRANHATFTLVIAVVVMLVFVLGLPLFNVDNFVPGRWFAFLYAPMALLSALGLRHLGRSLDTRTVVPVLLVFVLVFPGVMLVSSDGTPDSPVFETQHERLSYTETELTAVQTLDDVLAEESGPIYTDHPYATVFVRTEAHEAEAIRLQDGRAVPDGPLLYREYQSDGGSFFRIGEGAGIRNPDRGDVCLDSANHVYANGDVRLCTPTAAA
ncbi:hypothetical protein [Haloarchaeobius sp. HRN-SO-5]|uniref:hypothetical protein n=1 Tax=Haloarchaeobius sp. HRN-SO-5 TaxID=3446118 RepID=UPI003EC15344